MPASCMAPALMTTCTAVARKIGGIESAIGGQFLHHADLHAPARSTDQLHVVHEAAHEKDAASAGLEDVLGGGRIVNRLGLEAFTLLGHADRQFGGIVERPEGELDGDELARIFAVAVLDRVDHRFADGDADPMNRVFIEARHAPHSIAQDLHEVDHVEQARDLQPYQAAAHRHWWARIIQYSRSMSSMTGSPLVPARHVPRVSRVSGRLRVPGDKSISHRYAMLAALADGTSHLTGYAPGADCAATVACLEALGVRVSRGPRLTIEGLGVRGLRAPRAALDAANSGTSMRLLAGILAAQPFT